MNNSEKVRLMETKPYGFKVEAIRKALKDGLAFYLDTYIGCRKVIGIDADGSWVITGLGLHQRSWAICSTQIDRWYIQSLSNL